MIKTVLLTREQERAREQDAERKQTVQMWGLEPGVNVLFKISGEPSGRGAVVEC